MEIAASGQLSGWVVCLTQSDTLLQLPMFFTDSQIVDDSPSVGTEISKAES